MKGFKDRQQSAQGDLRFLAYSSETVLGTITFDI